MHSNNSLPNEILAAIATFLKTGDIVIAIRVCKKWHTAFWPLLLAQVSVGRLGYAQVPLPVLHEHPQHVRRLEYFDFQSLDHFRPQFTGLRHLNLFGQMIDRSVDEDQFLSTLRGHFVRLVKENPNLREVFLSSLWPMPHKEFWQALAELPLCKLRLTVSAVDNRLTDDFWRCCESLESLDIGMSPIQPPARPKERLFPKMRSLTLSYVRRMDWIQQWLIISRCPNLQHLRWHPEPRGSQKVTWETITETCGSEGWPRGLQTLDLDSDTLSDQDLALVIQSIRPQSLQKLAMRKMRFGPLSFGSLASQYSSLKIVHWKDCALISSAMVQEILSSCRRLESLEARVLLGKDVFEGRPWVCSRLKRLRLRLIIPPVITTNPSEQASEAGESQETVDDIQRHVFQQLAILSNLRNLDMGTLQTCTNDVLHPGLDMRVRSGLDRLVTCKRMVSLTLGSSQKMEHEDLVWMLQNWPQLKSLSGVMNTQSKGLNQELIEIMRASGVLVYR